MLFFPKLHEVIALISSLFFGVSEAAVFTLSQFFFSLCLQQFFLSAGAKQQWFQYFGTRVHLGALCFQQRNCFQY